MLGQGCSPDDPRLIHLLFQQLSQLFLDYLECLEICVAFLHQLFVLVHVVLYYEGGSDAESLVGLLEIEYLGSQLEGWESLVESIQQLLIVVSAFLVKEFSLIFAHTTCVAVRAEHFKLRREQSVTRSDI